MRLSFAKTFPAALMAGVLVASCGKSPSDAQLHRYLVNMNLPPEGGRVAGALIYPADEIPEDLQVCATDVLTGEDLCEFTRVTGTYMMDLPAGKYLVWAQTEQRPGVRAYFTPAIACGLTPDCTDHQPITLEIEDGTVIQDVIPGDWFASR